LVVSFSSLASRAFQEACRKLIKESFEALPFRLVPLAEQKRIVAKVDELMHWCDALETRLTAAETTAANCWTPPSTKSSPHDTRSSSTVAKL
jgi:hypothetical protein